MSLFKRRKKIRPEPIDLPDYDSVEEVEELKNLLLGTEYDSFLLEGTPRSAVLKRVSIGDPIALRWWTPPGWDAELLFAFHGPSGLDLGSIGREVAERVRETYDSPLFVGRVIEMPVLYDGPSVRIEWKVYGCEAPHTEYTCKLVGVTFEGRQDALREIFETEMESDSPRLDIPAEVEIREYEDGERFGHALYCDVDGVNIGTVGHDDRYEVQAIAKRTHQCTIEPTLNGVTLREALQAERENDEATLKKLQHGRKTYNAILTIKA